MNSGRIILVQILHTYKKLDCEKNCSQRLFFTFSKTKEDCETNSISSKVEGAREMTTLQSGKTNHFESLYLSPRLQQIRELKNKQPCLNDREIQLEDKRILQKLA